jgi:hypothetical protein
VTILPVWSNLEYWHQWVLPYASEICFIEGRIPFYNRYVKYDQRNARSSHAIAIFDGTKTKFEARIGSTSFACDPCNPVINKEISWIQCALCQKWRVLPRGMSSELASVAEWCVGINIAISLIAFRFCGLSPDFTRNRCSAPEEADPNTRIARLVNEVDENVFKNWVQCSLCSKWRVKQTQIQRDC